MMIAEAKDRGKFVHIGRVNSARRVKNFFIADSVDGTTLTIGRSNREEKIKSLYTAVMYCRNKKNGKLNQFGQFNFMGDIK